MSTSITTAFITQYEAEVHNVFQRQGSFLLPSVRRKTGVVGSTAVFQKVGTGVATTKSRHGTITPMNQSHTAPSASLVDFYAGDWVDKLDEAKTNIDERKAIAEGGAWALGRKVDNQIITALDGTSQSTITITVTSIATIRASLLEWIEAMDDNDVPADGQRYALLTPRAYSQAMLVKEFNSADYVDAAGMAFKDSAPLANRWRHWMGVNWKVHTGLPGKGTATAACFAYHRRAIAYASAKSAGNIAERNMISADITWHGDRSAHWVNHVMSGGAVLIDDTGVIQATLDDTAAIATS